MERPGQRETSAECESKVISSVAVEEAADVLAVVTTFTVDSAGHAAMMRSNSSRSHGSPAGEVWSGKTDRQRKALAACHLP